MLVCVPDGASGVRPRHDIRSDISSAQAYSIIQLVERVSEFRDGRGKVSAVKSAVSFPKAGEHMVKIVIRSSKHEAGFFCAFAPCARTDLQ